MRRYSRRLAKFLTVAFVVSIFTPLLLCGGDSFTKAEASDCCRAMGLKCHKNNSDSACCKHQNVGPLDLAVTSAAQLAPPQPLATIGLFPIVAKGGLLENQTGHRLFELFSGHSPPENVPLFILHSTLLI